MNALRTAGCSVQSLASVGEGAPDILVGRAGLNYLLEVKTTAKASKLNVTQEMWHRLWRGTVTVVRSPEEALQAVGLGSSTYLSVVRDEGDERTVLIRRPRRPGR